MNLEELYDPTSSIYTKGEVVVSPPTDYDRSGLLAEPSPETIGALAVDAHTYEAQAAQAGAEAAALDPHIAAARDVSGTGRPAKEARVAALETREGAMREGFPAAQAKELAELETELARAPGDVAVLVAKQEALRDYQRDLQAKAAATRAEGARQQGIRDQHQERRIVFWGQRHYWRVATARQIQQLVEAGYVPARIPMRREPTR